MAEAPPPTSPLRSLRSRPPFSALPLLESGPRGNAWGLYGPDDEIGALNLLTPEVIREAAKEIREGIRICTDLPLDFLKQPFFNRDVFKHEIRHKKPRSVNDDWVGLNTQSVSQWDGLRHYGIEGKAVLIASAYQDEQKYYGGITQDEIHNTTKIGIHNMVSAGGITGRGVLLDWDRWSRTHPNYNASLTTTTHSIPLSDLLAVASHQNTFFKPGDILFVRTGWTAHWSSLPDTAKAAHASLAGAPAIGVQSSEEILRWLWETGFVAVAGDQPAFEAYPFVDVKWQLHQWCLAGWGMPIGELFDLERLARECERVGKWSFWFSAAPLNVPGGVASTGNGVAVL